MKEADLKIGIELIDRIKRSKAMRTTMRANPNRAATTKKIIVTGFSADDRITFTLTVEDKAVMTGIVDGLDAMVDEQIANARTTLQQLGIEET